MGLLECELDNASTRQWLRLQPSLQHTIDKVLDVLAGLQPDHTALFQRAVTAYRNSQVELGTSGLHQPLIAPQPLACLSRPWTCMRRACCAALPRTDAMRGSCKNRYTKDIDGVAPV